MNILRLRFAFVFAVLLMSFATAGGQVLTSPQIDALVERTMTAFDVPGIAVGVIKDGKVVHAKGYGVRSLASKDKTDADTLFGIASNSKAFTTTALGILVDEGKLKWDDKVVDYIPEFKLYNSYVTEEFTIRDLLTHRSGLGLGAGDLMFFPDSSDFTLKDVIRNLRFYKQVSGFRSKFDYDNNLYIVAGEVVARVSGKSWDDFVTERIFAPLGMTKTATSFEGLKDRSNVIDGHAPVDGKVAVIKRHASTIDRPAGGIYSNITDLSKWVMMLLAKGKFGDKQLISEDVHRELWSPQTILPVRAPGPYNTHFAAYGLGFFMNDTSGYKQIWHTGGLNGMVTQITMFPELNLGIIVLTNQQEGGAFTSITNQIKDGYLGRKETDWVSDLAARRKAAVEQAKAITDKVQKELDAAMKSSKTGLEVSQIAGTYSDVWFGDISIAVKDGKTRFVSKRSPLLTGEIFAYKANTFVVKWDDRSMDADAFAVFTLDEEGKASGFTMRAISPLTDFSYDFHDLNFKRVK